MSTIRERAEELANLLDDLARAKRAEADAARARELAAFNDDDEPAGDEAEALYYVARGKALAFEDASIRVKLLAAGIAEGT